MEKGVEELLLLLIVTSNPWGKGPLEVNGDCSPLYSLLEPSHRIEQKTILLNWYNVS